MAKYLFCLVVAIVIIQLSATHHNGPSIRIIRFGTPQPGRTQLSILNLLAKNIVSTYGVPGRSGNNPATTYGVPLEGTAFKSTFGRATPPATSYGVPQFVVPVPKSSFGQPASRILPKVGNSEPSQVYGLPRAGNNEPSQIYGLPRSGNNEPSQIYGLPRSGNNEPTQVYGLPRSGNNEPSQVYGLPRSGNNEPSETYGLPRSGNNEVTSPAPVYGVPTTTQAPVTTAVVQSDAVFDNSNDIYSDDSNFGIEIISARGHSLVPFGVTSRKVPITGIIPSRTIELPLKRTPATTYGVPEARIGNLRVPHTRYGVPSE